LNPADLAVLIARLTGVAEEMGAVLRRSAYSANIKERADCSAALFTAAGELLVQAEHIPVHLGSMPAAVRAAIDACGDRVGRGDQVILNDPFAGGTHLNDVTLVAPVFAGERIAGWVANRAHHADVGGSAPGSMPPDATRIDEEGIRISPTVLDDAIEDRFVAASRTPVERRGDLDAQRGANAVGVARFADLLDAPVDKVLDYGERRMRAALAALPDGRVEAEDVLDSTGAHGANRRPATIRVAVTVAGDEIEFDFTGTAAQRPGNVNAVEAVTVSATAFALRAASDPTIPANGGALRPARIVAPPGTIVAAQPPVAVGAGNVEVSQRVADVCLEALARLAPGRVGAAGQGTMNNLVLGGTEPRVWVHYETIGGGQGARPGRDGMSAVHTGMTNTRDTPVEALERLFPLRVRRYGIRPGSGGDGRWSGGDGIWREIEALAPMSASLVTERRESAPPGASGGAAGARGENWLLPGGDERRAERVADKVTLHLRPGDVLRILTPGGGGWGPGGGVP
jgi:N-methylhydantoinase B/oxoprolinase/acetone carboxylase alpha subunit